MSHVLDGLQYHETILDTVGNTPLVRLRKVTQDVAVPVLGKLEFFNPGGSVKDRIAPAMVQAAEREGHLKPGGTIVECTSGNTGVGLAMYAAVQGYRAVFVMPDKVSIEKINLLKAYGAEVVITPTSVAADSPESFYSVAKRIAAERPGAYLMNQYHNLNNPAAHYRTTGPEIWEQTRGRVTHFVAGPGTGGTISGIGKFLKEKNPRIEVIGADPVGSILRHYKETGELIEGHPYKIEGVGEDMIPTAMDFSVIDRLLSCSDRDGLNMARRLAREEAIFVGGSAGMATWVAIEVAKAAKDGDLVVVLLPDTGERYLTKVHNDDWMRDNHLLDPVVTRVGAVLAGKGKLPSLIAIQAHDPLRKALAIVQQHDISQIPVFAGEKLVGTLHDSDVLKRVLEDAKSLDHRCDTVMSEPLPVVERDASADEVTRLMAARNPAVLVRDHGVITGVLTRFDMLQFIAGGD